MSEARSRREGESVGMQAQLLGYFAGEKAESVLFVLAGGALTAQLTQAPVAFQAAELARMDAVIRSAR
ncbi:hypothetical protein HPC49_48155 [Pyxidicoccus fallax]|uniref:Uncharacterized protein n=1 Tax=Pyxidicoccus fallax TaxID=394095 RepID=A0A848LZ08_9BACT|nr:hypothetical protein [Pyxidicoccus fallax]NMO22573.1 hypothetical protein [Pyxidicoccus fallax]NPC85946.1 hypothetical protein [Pyxidicoccus fallax]